MNRAKGTVQQVRRAPFRMIAFAGWLAIGPGVLLNGGCTVAVSVGIQLVGMVVDDLDVKKQADKLIGQPPTAADRLLGERLDTLRDIHSNREWIIYPVTNLNLLGKDRYVVEVNRDTIVALSRVEKTADPKLDIPRLLIIEGRIKGKSPAECEKELDVGRPLLTVRRDSDGWLTQMYDARIIKELSKGSYWVLRFDRDERCSEVEIVGLGASTKEKPF